MSEFEHASGTRENEKLTAERARELLASMPDRPQRHLVLSDHLCAVATIVLALISGLLAVTGEPWWAVIPAVAALMTTSLWLSRRGRRVNEPRLRAVVLPVTLFNVWMVLPIWRGITRGEMVPFPEAFVFAGLAPGVWLVFYLILLLRR